MDNPRNVSTFFCNASAEASFCSSIDRSSIPSNIDPPPPPPPPPPPLRCDTPLEVLIKRDQHQISITQQTHTACNKCGLPVWYHSLSSHTTPSMNMKK